MAGMKRACLVASCTGTDGTQGHHRHAGERWATDQRHQGSLPLSKASAARLAGAGRRAAEALTRRGLDRRSDDLAGTDLARRMITSWHETALGRASGE